VRWQKQVFIHTQLSRAYLVLARLSCRFTDYFAAKNATATEFFCQSTARIITF